MTNLHLSMLLKLQEIASQNKNKSENRIEILSTQTGSKSIDSCLICIANKEDFSCINNIIDDLFILKEYKSALLFVFEKIYYNESFDAKEVFDTFNI